ncbi:immunoglobulin-like domain-containing protein [Enterococcus hirae]
MNYKKGMFVTLLSVSILGAATTTTHVFADQNQSEKSGVSAPANSVTKAEKTAQSTTQPTGEAAQSAAKTKEATATQKTKEATPTPKTDAKGTVKNNEKLATVQAPAPTQPSVAAAQQNVTINLDKYVIGRSLFITGTYNNKDAVYMRAEVNGKKDPFVPSKELASGKIKYYVGNLNKTDKVDIVLFDKDYQEIGRQTVTFAEPAKTTMTLNDYVVGRSTEVTGTYTGGTAKYIRAEINGKKDQIVTSKELASGKIKYYVGNLKVNDNVQIVLFDQNYQEIGRQKVTIQAPAQVKINMNNYVIGKDSRISGTYEGNNAKYLRAVVNGKKEQLVSSKELADGKIDYYVGHLNQTDNIQIVLFDKNYQEIGRQAVPISVNQEFNILGSNTTPRLLISVQNQRLTVKEDADVQPGWIRPMNINFGSEHYFTLTITGPNHQNIYNHTWNGDTWVGRDSVVGTWDVPNGSTVTMYHVEGYTRFDTNDNGALRKSKGLTYTYKMENNRLVWVGVSPK